MVLWTPEVGLGKGTYFSIIYFSYLHSTPPPPLLLVEGSGHVEISLQDLWCNDEHINKSHDTLNNKLKCEHSRVEDEEEKEEDMFNGHTANCEEEEGEEDGLVNVAMESSDDGWKAPNAA